MSAYTNAAAVELMLVAIYEGNPALIDRLLAPEYVGYHGDSAAAFDRAGVRQLAAAAMHAPQSAARIETLAATADEVVARVVADESLVERWNDWLERPSFDGINVLRLRRGRIVEHRHLGRAALPAQLDAGGVASLLGAAPIA